MIGFKQKRILIICVSLFIVIGLIFGLVHINAEKRLTELENKYKERIDNVVVPKEIELKIDEEGKYDETKASKYRLAIKESSDEISGIIDEINNEERLSKNAEVKERLISLAQEKLDALESRKTRLSKQENKAAEIAKKHSEELKKKEAEEAAIKEQEEKQREEAEKEKQQEQSVAINKATNSSNKTSGNNPGQEQKSSSPTPKNEQPKQVPGKTSEPIQQPNPEPKPQPNPEPKPQPESPKPAYGTIVRSNPYETGNYKPGTWEHGEYYYQWDSVNNSWTIVRKLGSTVTDPNRWFSTVEKAFPMPTHEGKPGEVVNKGTIWIYFGG